MRIPWCSNGTLAVSCTAAALSSSNLVLDVTQHLKLLPHGRCIQTARLTSEGLKIPPERWTVSVAVCEVRTLGLH